MKRASVYATFLLFLISPNLTLAQVVINEISPGSKPEWVELYKTSEGEFGLNSCVLYLHDNEESKQRVDLNSEMFGAEQKYKKVTWTANWLNNGGDTVILKCAWGVSRVSYGSDVGAKTYGRSPDGGDSMNVLELPTPEGPNSAFLNSSTPSSAPLPSPTPTATPSPSLTPSFTPSPVASPSLTAVPLTSTLPTASVASAGPAVFGAEDANNNVPPVAVVLIATGGGLFGFGIISLLSKLHGKNSAQT